MWPLGVALTQSSTPFPAPHQVSISLPTPLNYATAFLVQRCFTYFYEGCTSKNVSGDGKKKKKQHSRIRKLKKKKVSHFLQNSFINIYFSSTPKCNLSKKNAHNVSKKMR